jgi:hypothetical protein
MRLTVPGAPAPPVAHNGEAAATASRCPRTVDGVTVSFECLDRAVVGHPKPEHAAWVPKLRRIGRARLRLWGVEELVDPAEMLISELVTNAVAHGRGSSVCLSLSFIPGQTASVVRIEVNDGSRTKPSPKSVGPYDESGRGLWIVEMITAEYGGGWGTSDEGRTWCTLKVPEPSPSESARLHDARPVQQPPGHPMPRDSAILGTRASA